MGSGIAIELSCLLWVFYSSFFFKLVATDVCVDPSLVCNKKLRDLRAARRNKHGRDLGKYPRCGFWQASHCAINLLFPFPFGDDLSRTTLQLGPHVQHHCPHVHDTTCPTSTARGKKEGALPVTSSHATTTKQVTSEPPHLGFRDR